MPTFCVCADQDDPLKTTDQTRPLGLIVSLRGHVDFDRLSCWYDRNINWILVCTDRVLLVAVCFCVPGRSAEAQL